MSEKPSESAIIAAYGEAERVRERFRGHDDSWIIAELWNRLSEARREAGRLRHNLGCPVPAWEAALAELRERGE